MCDVVQDADHEVAAVAGSQGGVIGRRQLRASGVGRGAIDHRRERKRLHTFHRGVYLVGHEAAAERADLHAALIAGGEDAYISARTALETYGVVEHVDGPVHIVLTKGCRRSRSGLLVHRTRCVHPLDFGTLGDIRITSPARALLDHAMAANPRELEWAVNEAYVQRLVTRQDLYGLLDRTRGHRGGKGLRAVVDRHDAPSKVRSEGEKVLLGGLRSARIRGFETNAIVHGREVDFFFADAALVVEVDSGRFHGTPTALDRDRRKDAFLRTRGVTVLRYSWSQVNEELPALIAEIAAHLGAARRP